MEDCTVKMVPFFLHQYLKLVLVEIVFLVSIYVSENGPFIVCSISQLNIPKVNLRKTSVERYDIISHFLLNNYTRDYCRF